MHFKATCTEHAMSAIPYVVQVAIVCCS